MIIRNEQFDQLQAYFTELADSRMVEYARRRFPKECREKSDNALSTLVRDVRRDALSHGLCEEPDVATALDLTIMYGSDFYSNMCFVDIFTQTEWDGPRKLAVVRERVHRQVPTF